MATYHPSRKPSKLYEEDMRKIVGGAKKNSNVTFSYGPFHTDVHEYDNQLELIFSSFVQTQGVSRKTYWKQWMIEIDGMR